MPQMKCPACDFLTDDLDVAYAAVQAAQLTIHSQTEHRQDVTAQKVKLDPPEVDTDFNSEQWESFKRQWGMFKKGMSIPANMINTALFYCCTQELRCLVLRDIQKDLLDETEDDLLATIKRLAVNEESVLSQRLKLGKMTQTPGTGIRTFLASLRGQAALCDYTAKCKETGCTHKYDFSEEIILDNLVRGMSDQEIMADLLGDSKTDRTLDETINFIAQKEQGKATQNAMGNYVSVKATDISGIKGRAEKNLNSQSSCWACGGKSHGPRNDRAVRSERCPAWTFTCNKCHGKGHYTSSCSKCSSCNKWGHLKRFCKPNKRSDVAHNTQPKQSTNNQIVDIDDTSNGAIFDQLCGTDTAQCLGSEIHQDSHLIDHHIFNGQWIERKSEPHPTIKVVITPSPADHLALGHPLSDTCRPHSVRVTMIADSGCQSCIMPVDMAYKMGLSQGDFIPVKLKMRGASGEDLCVCGGIAVDISTTDLAGFSRCTKQMMYLSDRMSTAFLSKEAMVSLGILQADFPAIHTYSIDMATSVSAAILDSPICSCPKRPDEPPPLPTCMPPGLDATPENIPALKEWILNYYGASSFNTCEHQPLRMMQGEPMRLHVDPEARPSAVQKPAVVPIHWQERVFKDLERDVRLGILEKVPPNTPDTWCSRMVVTAKADGAPRRTVDLQHVNRNSVRQTHHVESPFHLADKVPQGSLKTVTDAWNGFHSMLMYSDDRHITTFITPWGRYRYRVAPQGFLASGDAYNQRFDEIISNFPDKVKCVDDTLMWTFSIKDAFFQLCRWCELTYRGGITLNPTKVQFAGESVDFAGLTITSTNIRPSAKFIDAVKNFPTPRDISGARAWFGLVNQGSYAFAAAKKMQPFRHLIKPSNKFIWNEELENLFRESKNAIIEEMKEGVRLFEIDRPTCLCTDWSIGGIGFIMKQKYCECLPIQPTCCPDGWKLCLVGSRFTTPAESRYSPVEGEALAVVYALHQTRYYILGCKNLIIATDHKPLLKILDDRPLTEITNRRLLNLKEKTLSYAFSIVHVPGRKNTGPDAASRYPTHNGEHLDLPCEPPKVVKQVQFECTDDAGITTAACFALQAVSDMVTWEMVREATASDPILLQLIDTVQKGFPAQARDLHPDLRPYFRYSESISCVDGVILIGERIVIPQQLRSKILSSLHAAHQGVGMMIARASDAVYWPNMTTDISKVRVACTHCNRIAKSNPMQPPADPPHPDYPFQMIACDYFQYGNNEYVVIVDRYSGWPMVYKSESGANGLVKRLRETFVTFGVPEEITSDGGPQFTAGVTQQFLDFWKVHHRKTSVANPHANSRAEIAVKTVKRLLMDNTGPTGSLDTDNFQRAILTYRNSIDPETKASPALILFGRPVRDAIPIPPGRYCPHNTWKELLEHRERALAKRHSREHEKWSEHTQMLQPLQVGDHVYIQNLTGNHPKRWERTGVVVEVRQFHQYVVRVDGSGRVTLRNRQHLRKFTPFWSKSDKSVPLETPASLVPVAQGISKPNLEICPPKPSLSIVPDLPTPHEDIPATDSDLPSDSNDTDEGCQMPTEPVQAPTAIEPIEGAEPQQQTQEKVPRALTRLMPHNKPGRSEVTQVTSENE